MAFLLDNSMVNLPLKSDVVPFEVPFSKTVTLGNSIPSVESEIVPVTVVCAKLLNALKTNITSTKFIIFCIIIKINMLIISKLNEKNTNP